MGNSTKGAGRPGRVHARNLKILDRELLELEKRRLVALRGDRIYLTPQGDLQVQLAGVQAMRKALKGNGLSTLPADELAEDLVKTARVAS